MATFRFRPTGLQSYVPYRLDTTPGSTTPATLTYGGGRTIAGAVIKASPQGDLGRFEAGVRMLYAKPLTSDGVTTTAGAPVPVESIDGLAGLAAETPGGGTYAPLNRGGLVDASLNGVACDGTTDDTDTLTALLTSTATFGAGVYIPAQKTVRITNVITPPTGARIEGGPGATVRQETVNKPAFDVFNVHDVVIERLKITNSATRTYLAASFRGSAGYVYSAGIWSNGSRCTFRDITVSGFTCGVYITSWNGTNFLTNAGDNTVENLDVSAVDFGLLVVGQDRPKVSGVRGTYSQTSGSGNPPHLIYWSDGVVAGGSQSRGASISDCSASGGTDSYPFQFKHIKGGTITGLSGWGCAGSTAVFSCEDVTITGVSSRGDLGDGSGNGVIYFGDDDSARTRIENVAIQMAAEARIARVGGTDCTIRGLTATTAHAATADTAEVTIQGTRCGIADASIVNSNSAGGWRAYDVTAGTDNFVRASRAQYCRTGVYVNSSAAGTSVDVDPSHLIGASGYAGFRTIDNNSTTSTIARPQRRVTYTGTGGTFTFQAAQGDYHEITITGATTVTVAEPSTYSRAAGSQIVVAIINSSGGAMGTITWNATFVFRGSAPAAPTSTNRIVVTFVFDGTNWQELARVS